MNILNYIHIILNIISDIISIKSNKKSDKKADKQSDKIIEDSKLEVKCITIETKIIEIKSG